MPDRQRVIGLFAGIGGIEVGLGRSGFHPEFLCEYWSPARDVLAARFPGVPVAGDIEELSHLPPAEVVTAGFPCTDLSQAGMTAGLEGQQSGLVRKALSLIDGHKAQWLLLENVRNMLPLHKGNAIRAITDELERMGFRWAYRVVDSRFTGVPQRRQRVLLLASRKEDPRPVLFADDAGERLESSYRDDAYGFYWTEGLRGLGWCHDGVPTLKGGSTIGIPSPPAVWLPENPVGQRFVTPGVGTAERMQGFRRGWTNPASGQSMSKGSRWKLIGNAVSVGVSEWPLAAWGESGQSWRVDVSMWPERSPYQHLVPLMGDDYAPLSMKGASGFLSRLDRGNLRVPEEFRLDLKEHIEAFADLT
jgi:DNA (cytosine-5)-methyltransferase 1